MLQDQQIVEIEETLFRAWPALATRTHHGWVMRFAGGYTRRANSVNPIRFTGDVNDLATHVSFCEDSYREAGLPVVFRLTHVMQPTGLEIHLESQGYVLEAPTLVQVAELAAIDGKLAANVTIENQLSDDWLGHFLRLNPAQQKHAAMMRQMLQLIAPSCAFARLVHQDHVVAVGLGVHDGRYLGLFDIVTAPEFRRQGLGSRLVESLLAWGKAEGADTAYLQVTEENIAAQNLYRRFGFQNAYRYWYRVRSRS